MVKEKILVGQDGNLYYPFDDEHVWIFNSKEDKWTAMPRPEFLSYLPDGKLVELDTSDCSCNARDLFNFGCRC